MKYAKVPGTQETQLRAALTVEIGADLGNELAVEISQLTNRLMSRLGAQAFCVWLASSTPAAWVIDAPLTEVRDGLRNKLNEIQETSQ